MIKGFEDMQKLGKTNFEAAVKSFGEVNKGFQAIAAEMTGFGKKAFEEGAAHVEKLMGARSMEQAFEMQLDFARKAYDDYVAQASRLSEMYVDLAKDAYKPVESAVAKSS